MAPVRFAERLPWLVAVRGRRTRGQCTALEAIGFALGVPPRDAVLEIVWPARHTALGGPLDGTRRFGWGRAATRTDDAMIKVGEGAPRDGADLMP